LFIFILRFNQTDFYLTIPWDPHSDRQRSDPSTQARYCHYRACGWAKGLQARYLEAGGAKFG